MKNKSKAKPKSLFDITATTDTTYKTVITGKETENTNQRGNDNMNEVKVNGNQTFMGQEIPVVTGGFGVDKKCLADKTIAEIHNQKVYHVRELINKNIQRFHENVDIIDLKIVICENDNNLLEQLGYSKMQISKADHIYILSERGYAKLIKIMDSDLAWEIHDKLIDEYFTMREIINSDEQKKAELLLQIYNGGQAGVLASKELTKLEVQKATAPLITNIQQQQEIIKAKDEQLEEQEPFVQFAMKLQDTNDTVTMEQAAKILKEDGIDIGRNTLFKMLRDHKILMSNNSPYQKYIESGFFKITVTLKEDSYCKTRMYPVTKVTGKGLIFINKKLRKWFGMRSLDFEL